MPQTLQFRVENAQVVTLQREVDVPGIGTATVNFDRAVIEALPLDAGATLSLTLPAEALSEFPEGTEITVTVAANPAAQPAEGA